MTKITASEMKQLMHTQIQSQEMKWISIKDSTITNQFVSNLRNAADEYKKHYGFSFVNCIFEGGFSLKLFNEEISINIRDCVFNKSLTISNQEIGSNQRTGRRYSFLSLVHVIVKGPLSINVQKYERWRLIEVETKTIELKQHNSVESIILGKIDFKSIQMDIPLEEKPDTVIEWCDESMIPTINALLPGVRIKGIFKGTNGLRRVWPFL
jgi:hypothetical protein